jgi:hypothetical protein
MAHKGHRLAGNKRIQHQVEIDEIILKPVALRVPVGAPVTTPVRRDELIVARKGVDHELKGRPAVARTVQQNDRRRLRRTPSAHMTFQAADLDKFTARGLARLVRGNIRHRAVHSHPLAGINLARTDPGIGSPMSMRLA